MTNYFCSGPGRGGGGEGEGRGEERRGGEGRGGKERGGRGGERRGGRGGESRGGEGRREDGRGEEERGGERRGGERRGGERRGGEEGRGGGLAEVWMCKGGEPLAGNASFPHRQFCHVIEPLARVLLHSVVPITQEPLEAKAILPLNRDSKGHMVQRIYGLFNFQVYGLIGKANHMLPIQRKSNRPH